MSALGYTLAFGADVGTLIGDFSFVGLHNVSAAERGPHASKIPHQAYMAFQGMFAIIALALVTGGFAERMKFSAYVLFSVLWVTIVYVPVAHWVWGGGWIGELGALDFAGGNVVHINTGVAALAAAVICWVLKMTIGLRVSGSDEITGLDAAEHGETAYRL